MADLTRRTLLRSAGIATAAAAAPALLAACGSSSGSTTGKSANKGTTLAPWPTYARKSAPPPDLAGDAATGVEDGYLTYPSTLTRGYDGTPGDGSTLKVMTITYGTAPTPEADNRYWQAIEKALGVKIEFTPVPTSDFQSKMATVMAGGDLPDVLNIGGGAAFAHEADFVLKTMADLSEHLSGDAVKDYPNLANLPTNSWKAVGRFRGGIYGVPIQRAKPGNTMWINADAFEKQGYQADAGSFSRDAYTAILQGLTHGKQYGLGGSQDSQLGFTAHAAFHGVPSNWALSGGTFRKDYESEHFPQMLAFLNTLWKKGLYYPDSNSTFLVNLKTQFYNGTVKSYSDGFGALATTLSTVHDFKAVPMAPYSPPGITPTPYAGTGKFGYTVINKKLPKAKVKMVLRVLDWLASPFGTEEYQLLMYGKEGVHFTYSKSGDPVPTKLGGIENNINVPFGYLCSAPQVLYVPGAQAGIKAIHEWQRRTCPTMVSDPTSGLRSDTWSTKGAALQQPVFDTIAGIITGRQKPSAWNAAVKQWRSGGGDTIAAEFGSEYAANTTK